MSRHWGGGEDRHRQVTYVVDAATPLSVLGDVDGYTTLIMGENRGVVLRLSPLGAARVVRLLQAAES